MKINKETLMKKIYEQSEDDISKANSLVSTDKYYRPSFHIAPPNGLLNDPNGLNYDNGYHYIHYQWTPIQPFHGLKHWRLVKTKDFLNFEDLGVSIIPDHTKESHGAFSGSAFKVGNKTKIFYTGNIEDGKGHMLEEVQIEADFIDEKIINKRVVVEHNPEIFTHNARDPKIFRYGDTNYLVFGTQYKKNMNGGLAVYKTNDFEKFEFCNILQPSIKEQNYGYMWECPNIDIVDGKILYIMSSEGWFDSSNKYELNNSRNVVYTQLEKFDPSQGKLNEIFPMRSVDFGHDYYAPQTYWCENKLLSIAWFGGCDVQYPTDVYSWHSMLTIPRELSFKKDRLIQKPFAEFKKNILNVGESKILNSKQINCEKAFHLSFQTDENVEIQIANANGEKIVINFTETEIIFDRSLQSEFPDWNFEGPRFAKRLNKNQKVEIYVDHSAIEIFADNYETTFTSRFFIKDFDRIVLSKPIEVTYTPIKAMNYIKK